jgi:hypothetical protein
MVVIAFHISRTFDLLPDWHELVNCTTWILKTTNCIGEVLLLYMVCKNLGIIFSAIFLFFSNQWLLNLSLLSNQWCSFSLFPVFLIFICMFNPERNQEFSIQKIIPVGWKKRSALKRCGYRPGILCQFPRNLQLSLGCKT